MSRINTDQIASNSGGTTALTIADNGGVTAAGTLDVTGNVGIGETASANLLHVKASDTGIAPHASAQIVLEREGTNYLQFLTAENGTSGCLFGDGSDVDVGKIVYDHNVPAMQFQVETAERMRIDSAGNVLVGKTSTDIAVDGCRLASFGAILTRAGNEPLRLNRRTSNGTITKFDKDGSTVGTISVTGSATAYNTSSDYRLKENVDYTWDATTRLKQLKPARFNFIADADRTVDGFLAHEVSSIVPEAITGTKDAMTTEILYVEGDELPEGVSIGDVKEASVPDYQGIDQSKLVPLLVKTIQELEARITALEA